MDSALSLKESRRRVLNKAKGAEASIRRLVTRFGVPPASARNLQQALIHGTLLYGAELAWDESRKMAGEVQRLTDVMGRASLGVRQRAPSLWRAHYSTTDRPASRCALRRALGAAEDRRRFWRGGVALRPRSEKGAAWAEERRWRPRTGRS